MYYPSGSLVLLMLEVVLIYFVFRNQKFALWVLLFGLAILIFLALSVYFEFSLLYQKLNGL